MVSTTLRKPIPWFWLVLTLSTIALLGFLVTYAVYLQGKEGTEGPNHSLVTVIPRPTSMSDFVNMTDVIVAGKVGAVVRETSEGPYNPEALGNDPRDVPKLKGMPFTYYEIEVEEVFLDGGSASSGRPLLLRVNGRSSSEAAFGNMMPMPHVGDRFLFMLGKNPDGASFGHWGPWGLLDIEGEVVRFHDWNRTPVTFTANKNPSEFLAELRDSVEARSPAN
jgi:hypothetical protein